MDFDHKEIEQLKTDLQAEFGAALATPGLAMETWAALGAAGVLHKNLENFKSFPLLKAVSALIAQSGLAGAVSVLGAERGDKETDGWTPF